jgi:hypothetical protein
MRGLIAFMSNLMLFLTLGTLISAMAMFFAHKLKQRSKPKMETLAQRSQHEGPSMVQAYEPKRRKVVSERK